MQSSGSKSNVSPSTINDMKKSTLQIQLLMWAANNRILFLTKKFKIKVGRLCFACIRHWGYSNVDRKM